MLNVPEVMATLPVTVNHNTGRTHRPDSPQPSSQPKTKSAYADVKRYDDRVELTCHQNHLLPLLTQVLPKLRTPTSISCMLVARVEGRIVLYPDPETPLLFLSALGDVHRVAVAYGTTFEVSGQSVLFDTRPVGISVRLRNNMFQPVGTVYPKTEQRQDDMFQTVYRFLYAIQADDVTLTHFQTACPIAATSQSIALEIGMQLSSSTTLEEVIRRVQGELPTGNRFIPR